MFAKLTQNFRPLALAGAAAIAAGAIAAPAPAMAEEQVFIAQDYDGGDAKHGFWSNPKNSAELGLSGTNNAFFSFDGDGVVFTLDEMASMASLVGWAYNPQGVGAFLDIAFTGYSDPLPGGKTFKNGSGTGSADADFFTGVSGSITIDGDVYTIENFAGSTVFQYGFGATDKSPAEFGGSAWLLLNDPTGAPLGRGDGYSHVDLNFSLTAVPEPATWMMLLLGFFGVGLSLRRARRQEVAGALSAA